MALWIIFELAKTPVKHAVKTAPPFSLIAGIILSRTQLSSMSGEIIGGILILQVVAFLFIIPSVLYSYLKKIRNPVQFWLPPIMAAGIYFLFITLPPWGDTTVQAIRFFSLIFVLNTLAILTLVPFFDRDDDSAVTRFVLTVASFAGIICMAFAVLSGSEMRIGMSWPQVSTRVPFLVGNIVDSLIRSQGLQDVVYAFNSPVYSTVISVSIFLEVILVSGILYLLFRMLFPGENGAGKTVIFQG